MDLSHPNRKPSVLIVEDDAIISMSIQQTLLDMGCRINAAVDNGLKALSFMEKTTPDLVVSDIVLGCEPDGIDLAREIRSRFGVPVVLITAYADLEKIRRAKLVQPFGYLIKPFQERDLKVTVEMALYTAQVEAKRVKAEKALQESEAMFRLVYEKSPTGVCLFDNNGRVLGCNRQLADLMGVDHPDRLVGFNYFEMMKDGPAKEAVRQAVATGASLFEGPYTSVSGGKDAYQKVHFKRVAENLLLGVYEDLTPRMRSEQALRESEEKYRLAMEATTDGLWDWDLVSNDVFFSRAWSEILEEKEVEPCRRSWEARVHPQDFDLVMTSLQEHLEGRTPSWQCEHRLKTRSGAYKWVLGRGRVVARSEDGRPRRMVGTMTDISARKKTEESLLQSRAEFEAVFNSITDPIILTDRERRIVMVNPAFTRVFGYQAEEAVGRSTLFIYENQDDFHDIGQKRFKVGGAPDTRPLELRCRRKNGEVFEAESLGCHVKDSRGEIWGFLGHHREITERKQAEKALAKSEWLLRETQRLTHSGGWEYDLESGRVAWTDEVYRLHGVSREHDPGGISGNFSFFTPPARRVLDESLQRLILEGEPLDLKLEFNNARGERLWVRVVAHAMRDQGRTARVIGTFLDITETVTAEQALRESESLYRLLFQSGNDAVFIHPLDDDGLPGPFLEANDIACQRLGYSHEDLLALSPLDIGAPAARSKAGGFGRILLREGRAIFETVHQAKNGRLIPVESSARLFDIDGRRLVLSIARDISERKKMEAILRESEEKYRRIVELSPELIVVHQHGTILFINKAGVRLLGADGPEAIIGRKIVEFTVWSPEKPSREEMDRYLNGDEGLPAVETELIRLDGSKIEAEILSVPFLRNGEPAYQVMARDITQRKQVEKKLRETEGNFRQLAANIRETFWLRDRVGGRMLYVSPAFETIWGRPREEIYQAPQTFFDAVHPGDLERIRESFQALESRGVPFIEEYRIVRPDGAARFVWVRSFPIYNEDGEIFRFAGIAEDVTARKQAELEREKMEGLLRQSQKMEAIGTLAGGIAHDFNNILSAILGYTELSMLDAPPENQLSRNLNQVLKAGRRARDLVRQILDFSRRTDRKQTFMTLAPIVKESMKLLRSSLPATIEITVALETAPLTILGDPTQIHQILMNLCANAAHALRRQGGRLEVTLSRVQLDQAEAEMIPGITRGAYAKLEVRDDGEGIPPLLIPRIFDPFFTTKGPGEGTGMGLAVVFGIIQNHGGGVRVVSEQGRGATFNVFLPLVEATPAQIAPNSAPTLPGGNESILFVDDERVLADLGKEILDHLGYRATHLDSSVEALEVFKKSPDKFDLLITDYTMPRMTGLDLAEKIMEIRPDLPIILCTGFSRQAAQDAALRMGVKKILMKPLVINEVAQVVREVLDEAKNSRVQALGN
ncbi:MAG: PAS domain S-box protein [Pseudomonadota bacterium]